MGGHHPCKENWHWLLQETHSQTVTYYHRRESLHQVLQEIQSQVKIHHHHNDHPLLPHRESLYRLLQETQSSFRNPPPPWAEPALQPPSLSAPDLHHQPAPPPEIYFPFPVFVCVWVFCNFIFSFHVIYGILYALSVK